MKDKVEKRLLQLRGEYQKGKEMMKELTQKQQNLEQTLLRIAGAIQVLEEMTATEEQPAVAEDNNLSATNSSLTNKGDVTSS